MKKQVFYFAFAFVYFSLCLCVSVVQTAPFYRDKTKLLVYLDADGKEHPITKAADWSKRREHILANMQLVMGPLPDASRKVPLDVRISEEKDLGSYVRKKLTFAVEKDDRVPAYLMIPKERKGKLPGMLVLHQTIKIGKDEPAGLGTQENKRIGVHLVERGYVVLAPDYPSFGEYPYDFKKSSFQSGSMKAVWNNMRAIDLLQSLPEVDAERIGCIGHSLGGHNSMFTAVFDTRIKAVVSNCGFTSFPKYYNGNLKGWTSDRYMPWIASKYESKPEKMPFDFTEVVAALAPRAFLASSPLHDDNFEVSGVKDCITAAKPVYELLGAKEKLAANYPDCQHDFPPDVRKVAYEWLDRWLKEAPAERPKPSGARRLGLTVSETAGIRRFGYPVSAILPLPEPVVDAEHFRLLDGKKPIAAQFRPHGDTSKGIRSVSLDFNASPGPLERHEYVVEYGPGVLGSEPKNGLRVETTEKEFRIIHPSGLQFVVPRDLIGLLNQVQTKKLKFLDSRSIGLILKTKEDKWLRVNGPTDARLEMASKVVKAGPLAVTLRFKSVADLGSLGQVPFTVEMEFPISKSWVRVTWIVDDSRGDIASLGADLNLHIEGEPTLLDFGAGTSVYAQLKHGDRARLLQNPKGRSVPWETYLGKQLGMEPYVVAPGSSGPSRDAEGWAHVMDRQRCTALAVADFAKSKEGGEIMVYSHGQVRLWRHFGRPVKDVPRGTKQLTFWLHFVDMPVQVGAATSPQAMLAPLKVEVRPGS